MVINALQLQLYIKKQLYRVIVKSPFPLSFKYKIYVLLAETMPLASYTLYLLTKSKPHWNAFKCRPREPVLELP